MFVTVELRKLVLTSFIISLEAALQVAKIQKSMKSTTCKLS